MRKRARSEYGDRYWMIANYLSIKKRFSIPTSCSLSVILRSSITLNKKKIGRLVLCLYYSKWRRWYIHNHNNSTSNILLYQAMCNELKVTYRFTCQFRSFSNKFDKVYKITKFAMYFDLFYRRHTLSKRRIVPLPLFKADPETNHDALFPKGAVSRNHVFIEHIYHI